MHKNSGVDIRVRNKSGQMCYNERVSEICINNSVVIYVRTTMQSDV